MLPVACGANRQVARRYFQVAAASTLAIQSVADFANLFSHRKPDTMSIHFRILMLVGILFASDRMGAAKDLILRYDVLEVEYAKGDVDATGEPAKTTFRSIEVKIDEKSDFASTLVDQDWELKLSGRSTGFADGKLHVEGLAFSCAAIDGATSTSIGAPLKSDIKSNIAFVGGSSNTHVFHSIREPAKTERENKEQCEQIRKSVLELYAKRHADEVARTKSRQSAAALILELAQHQLKAPESEAVGRELLELVIRNYMETKSAREAKQIWNGLPGTTFKFPLDGPFGRGF